MESRFILMTLQYHNGKRNVKAM